MISSASCQLNFTTESFTFEDENEYEYEIKLKVFARVLKKKDTRSPDSKMIYLLTFDNFFPPLRHSR